MNGNIVILGGGPAGLALAVAFVKRQYRVTVIEKGRYASYKHGEHVPSTITSLLQSLHIPTSLLKDNSIKCNGIVGFWANKEIINHGLFNKNGFDYILNRPAFDHSVYQYAEQLGVTFHLGISSFTLEGNSVVFGNNISQPYDYLFDCTGRTSLHHNNTRLIFDSLIGISYLLPHTSSPLHDSEVIIDSTEHGWWYSISNSHHSIVTFFTDKDIYKDLRLDLNSELQTTRILKDTYKELQGKRLVMPCYTSILKHLPNTIFQVGDSFASYDPLSSLGIYKAFENALLIAEAFENNHRDLTNTYQRFQHSFLQYMDIRTEFYHQGFIYHQSEFYKRRVIGG